MKKPLDKVKNTIVSLTILIGKNNTIYSVFLIFEDDKVTYSFSQSVFGRKSIKSKRCRFFLVKGEGGKIQKKNP